MTQPRTVYLVDDNAQFRASAQWWLSGAGYEVRGFDDPQTALDALSRLAASEPEALRNACLLLDVRMPGMSGLDLHDRLAAGGIALGVGEHDGDTGRSLLPVVYMTGHGDVPLAVSAMQKGAVTMLEKPFADQALESALERAFAAAEAACARAQMRAAAAESLAAPPSADAAGSQEYQRRLASLSPRQRQIFDGVVAGRLSKQIAFDCGLSERTVEHHRKLVMTKFKARTAMELMRMAMNRCVEPQEEAAQS
jgi:FixJ family two-component response regulator